MRKHLSVLSLWWSMSWRLLLGVTVGMALGEGLYFAWSWQSLAGTGELSLDRLLSPMGRSVFIGFLLLFASLTGLGFQRRSRVRYTLDRLRVRPESAVMWHWACIALCLLILWAAQAAILLALCALYCHLAGPDGITAQTVFLAVYRIDALHDLLPLASWDGWLRGAVSLLLLSMAPACAAHFDQHKRAGAVWAVMIPLLLLFLIDLVIASERGVYSTILWTAAALTAMVVWGLLLAMDWKEGGSEDDAEDA